MKLGIGSDVHSNWPALEAVVADMKSKGVDQIIFLGDLVGYNAHPEKCVRYVAEHGIRAIAGNHCVAVLKEKERAPANRVQEAAMASISVECFNKHAMTGLDHSILTLSDESVDFLSKLPFLERFNHSVGAHTTYDPEDPFDYGFYFARDDKTIMFGPKVQNTFAAMDELAQTPGNEGLNTCFVGHSHSAGFVAGNPVFANAQEGYELHVGNRKRKTIVDVGSVGQPRDCNPRASWVEYDLDKEVIIFRRTPYDIDKVADDNHVAGLPKFLSSRLYDGH